jgi:hypothetical protein
VSQAEQSRPSGHLEADLLADGRRLLTKLCDTLRTRHLYPAGPNLALLLEAWQALQRERTVGRIGPRPRPQRRRLRTLIRALVKRDVALRSLRLTYQIPVARPQRLQAAVPPLVERALQAVEDDARPDVRAHLGGASRAELRAAGDDPRKRDARLTRGLAQLRDALLKEALAHPGELPALHPQYLAFAAAGLPTRVQHPILRLFLVKLPLYLWLGFFGLFTVAYIGAYFFLNDENLGRLLSTVIGRQINGDLELGSVHWRPTLIFDLLTGTPHHATVKDVKIWRGYKRQGGEREVLLGWADHVEAEIVLHEIIPWNRVGVPPVFEIPWVLHFPSAEVVGKLHLDVGEFAYHDPDGRVVWNVDLLDTFAPNPAVAGVKVETRAISFRMDEIEVHDVDLDLDFRPQSGWQTAVHLVDGTFGLYFEGIHPKLPLPPKKPLVFDVKARADTGVLKILALGYELPIEDLELRQFAAGGPVPLGDIRIRGAGRFAGSLAGLDGWLRDAFSRNARNVDMTILFDDAGSIGETIGEAHKLPPTMIDADGASLQLAMQGPLNDVTIGLAASGVGLDFFTDPDAPEPGPLDWKLRDADISLSMSKDPLPAMWSGRYHLPGLERWLVSLDRFDADALGGRVELREGGSHLVIGQPGEPLVISLHTEVRDVDPGQLFAPGPMRDRLAGRAGGVLDFDELVLRIGDPTVPDVDPTPAADLADGDAPAETSDPGPAPQVLTSAAVDQTPAPDPEREALRRLVLAIDGLQVVRDRGPADVNLPRELRADGRVVLDERTGLDLADLVLTVDGGTLKLDGGLDPEFDHFKPTTVRVRVSDGAGFLRGFGQGPYFERLTAGLTLTGPVARPSGTGGSLSVSDVGSGKFALTDIADVRLWMDRGVLSLRSPRVGLLGGVGKLDADLDFFADDPKVRVALDLERVDLSKLGGDLVRGRGDVEVLVADAGGKPVALSAVQATGALYVPRLQVGQGEFRDAEARFGVTRDGLDIKTLTLHHHRRVSPSFAPEVTVPVGDLAASGKVSFDSDPALALRVTAGGLPISAFTAIAGLTELPAGAQIGDGTHLEVSGTVARPSVHGHVELRAIHAGGIPLGSGLLELDSNDRPAGDGLVARREIQVKGSFGDDGTRKGPAYDWEMDALVVFGPKPRKSGKAPMSADLNVRFANLPLANALRAAGLKTEGLSGQLEGLTLGAQTCAPGVPLISSCLWDERPDERVAVHVEMDRLWAAARPPTGGVSAGSGAPGDPCRTSESLCSQNRLVATLDGTRLRLRDGWELRSGGNDGGAVLTLSGDVELSAPPARAAPKDAAAAMTGEATGPRRRCDGADNTPREVPSTGGHAEVTGELLLSALAPLLRSLGLGGVTGRVGMDLDIDGHIGDPIISGNFSVPGKPPPLTITAPDKSWSLSVPKLDLKWVRDTLFASGEVQIGGQTLQFGEIGGKSTFYTLGGGCEGNFSVAAQGVLDGRPLQDLAPTVLASSGGGLQLRGAHVAGVVGSPVDIHTMRATLAPTAQGLRVQLAEVGLDAITLTDGVIDLVGCGDASPCPHKQDGYAMYIGGVDNSPPDAPPGAALRARIGDRGRAGVWGYVVLSPDFSRLSASGLRVRLDEVAYRMFDNSGRPQLYATLGTDDLALEGRDSLALRGEVRVNRGRWIRDAQEGVKVLSFADPTTAPAQPPPEIVRDMALDLRIRTTAPFRVDNNVMKGVEGQVLLAVGGTLGDLEMSGKIDVSTGVLDIALLNGAYNIQYGKVQLEKTLSQSAVDVLALRQEPIYIDNQPRSMFLKLGGTLDAITWRCIVQGDTRTRSRTTRECVDYLVLGAGERAVADANVRRYGGGGLLGRPIGVVGNLTELKLGRYLDKNAPRLAPYVPDVGMRLGQLGIEVNAETPRPWFKSDWGQLTVGAGYTRGYPGNLLRNSYDWRVRFRLLDSAVLEFRDNRRSYFNERIIFDPLRQRSLELRFDYQLPSMR